eukprot:3059851-Rhodomonas_salina.1
MGCLGVKNRNKTSTGAGWGQGGGPGEYLLGLTSLSGSVRLVDQVDRDVARRLPGRWSPESPSATCDLN